MSNYSTLQNEYCLHCRRSPRRYSWTVVSKLSDILKELEEKYGERDKTFTILGIELTSGSQPQVWYPGNRKHIAIQITMECVVNLNRAVFQLAHEAVHCLSPAEGQKANVLEEGLATLFSIEYTALHGHGVWTSNIEKIHRSDEHGKGASFD